MSHIGFGLLEDGTKLWFQEDGAYHRVDGPAIIYSDGSQKWYLHGKLHKEDGPAVDHSNGYQAWWVNGVRHRVDGPAIIHPDGSQEWWVNGERRYDLGTTRYQRELVV